MQPLQTSREPIGVRMNTQFQNTQFQNTQSQKHPVPWTKPLDQTRSKKATKRTSINRGVKVALESCNGRQRPSELSALGPLGQERFLLVKFSSSAIQAIIARTIPSTRPAPIQSVRGKSKAPNEQVSVAR